MVKPNELSELLSELRREGINDPRLLAAIEKVPREFFVPADCRVYSFQNIALPIGEGQTISQPLVVALMTQSLSLTGEERVLEIGTGSGYQCAILAELSREVISIERLEALAVLARRRLVGLHYYNARVEVGDGSIGLPEHAPYDAIVITAGAPKVPEPLIGQLLEGGRLVLPIGSQHSQELVLHVKRNGKLIPHSLGPVRFVPLIGEAGWAARDAEER